MSNMSSLSIAVSGLRAAQSGLSVTGHNMSNSDVKGYTRQTSVQETFIYKNLGLGGTGLDSLTLNTEQRPVLPVIMRQNILPGRKLKIY